MRNKTPRLAVLLIFVALLVGVTRVSASQNFASYSPKEGVPESNSALQAQKTKTSEQNQEHTGNAAIKALTEEIRIQQQVAAEARENEKQRNEQETQRQSKLVWYTWYLVVVGFLQFVALIATWIFIRKQAELMKVHAEHLEKSAEAAVDNARAAKANAETAEKSVELLKGKERARIIMEVYEIPITLENTAPVMCRIEFYGPTEAFIQNARIFAMLDNSEKKPAENRWDRIKELPTVVKSGTEPVKIKVNSVPLLPEIQKQIQDEKLFLHFCGSIEYLDVFDEIHVTSFWYLWKIKPILLIAGKPVEYYGSWERQGTTEDNKQT